MQDLNVIGSEEWCVFGTLGIPAIKARVDSGAKTSSIQGSQRQSSWSWGTRVCEI
jgi:ribosomal protein S6--L-glutamate ligase